MFIKKFEKDTNFLYLDQYFILFLNSSNFAPFALMFFKNSEIAQNLLYDGQYFKFFIVASILLSLDRYV